MSKRNPNKPLRPGQVAKRLNIFLDDLPRHGCWTRGDVQQLRKERPQWLTDARRRYQEGVAEYNQMRVEHAEDILREHHLSPAPDASFDAVALELDEARMILLQRGIEEKYAEQAIRRFWPRATADEF